ncbi:MAG: CDP-alcohol phosphatidyltransferase family protein [Pararhizobium sp.]
MLDGAARRLVVPVLDRLGRQIARLGVTADQVTLLAFAVGIFSAVAIAFGHFLVGLALMAASRLGDGLDGAVARASRGTDFGGYLDIVLDFAFYGMIPFAFVAADPGRNAFAGAALLLAFYANGASFLAYAIVAEKHRMTTEARGEKSLYFTTGLAEATETYLVFAAFCLLPRWFPAIAWFFAALCLYTTLSRIVLASRVFRRAPGPASSS